MHIPPTAMRGSSRHYWRVWVQAVSEGWMYRNGFDPAFFDDSDMIECDICKREYDYKEYRSLTCSECESDQIRKERESK